VAEAFEGTNTTTDGALRLASVEIARTEFLVGGTSSDESVGNDQDFVPRAEPVNESETVGRPSLMQNLPS
jgi:hypothetical protein